MYDIHVYAIAPQWTAVVRSRTRRADFAKVVPQGCGVAWNFIKASGLAQPDHNMALYLEEVDGETNIECGVEVNQQFVGNEQIVCSHIPGGAVATTTHRGDYGRLGDAHVAIHAYCAKQGRIVAGPNWEIYGHWTENPAELRTDVFYLLK